MRGLRLSVLVALLSASLTGLLGPASAKTPPRWVQHVQNYPGGISNGVRARLAALSVRDTSGGSLTRAAAVALHNVQMNSDCDPPRPQNETSVAFDPAHPVNAVSAANDYCGDGFWIGFTHDGGQTWGTIFKDPKTSTGDRCFGSDPSVVYSIRDGAFYLSTLCFFSTSPISEVQVWRSTDGGATWTDSTHAAIVITNRLPNGSIDGSLFYDKELLAVDNDPSSPHFGRLYVTYIKFHMLPGSGRSDYCPAQLSFTDAIPGPDPSAATWTQTAIVPDNPGDGVGPGANQWAIPVVDDQHGLDVTYVSEDCNTAYDRALFFKRSTNGGQSFGPRVRVDKPGQFRDNPNRQDLLPAKHARLPISPSLVFDPTRGTLLYAYQNNINRGTSGADISLQVSDTYGATWSDARTITITAAGKRAPKDQYFPWLAVDPSGDVHAIWYDNRGDPGDKLIRTFQGLSTDGGTTWDNFNISSVAWNPDKSFFSCGCFIGDYNAMAAADHVKYPVWTDGRNTPGPPDGQTDIFTNVEISP